MATSDNLSPVQFAHQPGTPDAVGHTYHAVTASIGGNQVGSLQWAAGYKSPWDEINGQIQDVHVNPEHQHKGIATGLLKFARGIDPSVKHSPDQTEDGQEWSATAP
jgi:GNAT superfamily N-acetyltransferase